MGHQGGARGGQGRALAREHAAGDGDGGGGDQGGARQGHFGRGRAEGERGVAGGGGRDRAESHRAPAQVCWFIGGFNIIIDRKMNECLFNVY